MSLENGLHFDVPRETYDKLDRWHWSILKEMRRSPLHARSRVAGEDKDSEAMLLGRAAHCAILEPQVFEADWAVWRGGRKQGKEWEAFKAGNELREIISEDQHGTVTAMARAALTDPIASKHLKGRSEVTVLWTDTATGIDLKGRLDCLSETGIADLKTARDVSPDGFGRAAWNSDLLGQAALYTDGLCYATGKYLPYAFVAIENAPPFPVVVYRVSDALLDLGRSHYRSYLEKLAACQREKRWPGYADCELELQLPPWVKNAISYGEAA